MEANITKRNGIDTLVREYSPEKVEERKKLLSKGEPILRKIVDLRAQLDVSEEHFISELQVKDHRDKIERYFPQSLTPQQISALPLLLCTNNLTNKVSSLIISRLLQNSYISGHNNFNIKCMPGITYFGWNFAGTEERPLQLKYEGGGNHYFKNGMYLNIKAKGTQRHSFATDCENCDFDIEGNILGSFAQHTESSSFNVKGNVEADAAWCSKRSRFYFGGEVGGNFATHSEDCTFEVVGGCRGRTAHYAKRTEFILHANPGMISEFCQQCTFKTTNRDTLQKMLKDVPGRNRIVYIDDGKEEMVKDYR